MKPSLYSDVLSPGILPGPLEPEGMFADVKCPECGLKARKTTGAEIYPHRTSLAKKKFLVCKGCDTLVGCHKVKGHKWVPFGTMATKPLRKMRQQAHWWFDRLWKIGGMERKAAYAWMATAMNLHPDLAHIGMFNEDQCKKLIELLKQKDL